MMCLVQSSMTHSGTLRSLLPSIIGQRGLSLICINIYVTSYNISNKACVPDFDPNQMNYMIHIIHIKEKCFVHFYSKKLLQNRFLQLPPTISECMINFC